MKLRILRAGVTALTAAVGIAMSSGAQAIQINDLFLFGDSYTDTGAYVPLTNGSTAGAYLASSFGINLVTSKNAAPGTSGVNFSESGARVAQGPIRQRHSREASLNKWPNFRLMSSRTR